MEELEELIAKLKISISVLPTKTEWIDDEDWRWRIAMPRLMTNPEQYLIVEALDLRDKRYAFCNPDGRGHELHIWVH